MSAARAVISLGTNSTRLLVVDVRDGALRERYHEAVLTRLGQGLTEGGALAPQAASRTLDVVQRFATVAREMRAPIAGIATSALRRADDARAFAVRFEALAGAPLAIISGAEEAAYSFRGATYGTQPGRRVSVFDIGGGSTECAVGTLEPEAAVSVEVGAVRLTEEFPELAGRDGESAARKAADAALGAAFRAFAPFSRLPRAATSYAVAGTPRTIAGIAFAGSSAAVDGRELAASDVRAVLERLLRLPLEERRPVPGMVPQRADILPAGALVMLAVMQRLEVESAIVTRNDLLLGYLLAHGAAG